MYRHRDDGERDVWWRVVTTASTHLVTGRTPRFESLRVVTAAVQLSVLVEVDEVHQELLQHGEVSPDQQGGEVLTWHTEQAKHVGCQTLAGPALEAEMQMSPPTMESPHWANVCYQNLIWEKTISTCSHVAGFWRVTGICLTVPRPRASLFLWAENNLSSFFSSSLKLLQYLEQGSEQTNPWEEPSFLTSLHCHEAGVGGGVAWSDISPPQS